ncbi:MAG: DUF4331 family protein [Chitinophagaceae bacterium]
MKNTFSKALIALGLLMASALVSQASSHREAPLIASDPQADNTDLYAFKSPNDSNKIIIIANYIPMELPHGGPNWYTFGQNIRYEIHIKNDAATSGDDITYRFTFNITNEDSSTFFNIRLGKQNQKNTYKLERRIGATNSFVTIVSNGIVPPPNIGPRSIEGAAGLHVANYDTLMRRAIMTSVSGERVFAGPIDDPFFVDLGGAFDLGGFRQPGKDGLAKNNCHTLALEIPIATLQKSGKKVSQASSFLDPNFVIGVWASASRPAVTTFNDTGDAPSVSGPWIQISRLGMPLTNEVIIPIGKKDLWNSIPSGSPADAQFLKYFNNPELGLYVDSSINGYGKAVPGLNNYLRIQSASRPTTGLGPFDFRNTKSGLYPLKGNPALAGTAFDPTTFGGLLLPNASSPRSVDIMPIFMTGVPNLAPYQLAVMKSGGNPLAAGKPFINNFLPVLGDMLRLNMATPVTPRTLPSGAPNPQFSNLGILAAAVQGLTNPMYNSSTNMQFIPNMDGFPNGRRLEDDVTTISLQAIGGVALAAIGLWYDDYNPATSTSPLTPQLLSTIGFSAGIDHNDTTFKTEFPFVQQPWRAYNGDEYTAPTAITSLNLSAPAVVMVAYPNPFTNQLTFKYKMPASGKVQIDIMDISGRLVNSINEGKVEAGEHLSQWNGSNLAPGNYFARFSVNGQVFQALKLVKTN